MLTPGQTLKDRYRVVRLLGQGGFGAVYRAWDITLERPCALKERLDISPESERQFKREARLLANLSHPNLPRVTDYFTIADQGLYLVMDFVEGQDLEHVLDQNGGPLAEAQVLPWIIQVCEALGYLHSQTPPIVHRDIKPANIRLTPRGQAMLVDFGIAKLYDPTAKTTVGARAVTPGFSPQEQYGQGVTDTRSDIYALGATLYCLLTGQMPPESIQRNLGQALPAPRQFNPALSPATEQAILTAMEMLPERRWQSAAEFKAALQGVAALQMGEIMAPLSGKRLTNTVAVPAEPASAARKMATPVKSPHGTAKRHTPTGTVAIPAEAAPRPIPWKWIAGIVGLVVAFLAAGVGLAWLLGGGSSAPATPTQALPAAFVVRTPPSFESPAPEISPSPTLPLPTDTLAPTLTSSPMPTDTPLPSPSPEPALTFQGAGGNLRRDEQGVEMALIPAGSFQMGSKTGEADERPVHPVSLDEFYIDVTEVTNAMYAKCVMAGICTPPGKGSSATLKEYYGNPEYDDYPVIQVTWDQALQYCQWRKGGLPTEAQWERAARGGLKGDVYPWGEDQPICQMGAPSGAAYQDCTNDTVEVGSFAPNAFGLFDMAGNVWEWVWDWYSEDYYSMSPSVNPGGPDSGQKRVIRGGSWAEDHHAMRVAFRNWENPGGYYNNVGFRCVRIP